MTPDRPDETLAPLQEAEDMCRFVLAHVASQNFAPGWPSHAAALYQALTEERRLSAEKDAKLAEVATAAQDLLDCIETCAEENHDLWHKHSVSYRNALAKALSPALKGES